MKATTSTALLLGALASLVDAKQYRLNLTLTGQALLDAFNFGTVDYNHGVADYLTREDALAANLVNIDPKTDAVTLRIATKGKPEKRGSVRLESKAVFSRGVLLYDIGHIPTGCGTWPAIWATGPNWPTNGEIDLIEGVHETSYNTYSVHTAPGCMQGYSGYSGHFALGSALQNNCDAYATADQGCGVTDSRSNSFGPGFNSIGGGVYALVVQDKGVASYFWPRAKVPMELRSPSATKISGKKWGTPGSFVSSQDCDSTTFFNNMTLVINTGLCGDWAGNSWSSDLSALGQAQTCQAKTGYATCAEFVQKNPHQFNKAYWRINSIRYFQ